MDSDELRVRNDRVVAAAIAAGWTPDAALTLLCECASHQCEAMVPVTPRQHEARATESWFVVAPGHVDPTVQPIETSTEFWFVGAAAG